MGRASRLERRWSISSSLARGRPISHVLTVATARSLPVRGPEAACFAVSWPGPVYRK